MRAAVGTVVAICLAACASRSHPSVEPPAAPTPIPRSHTQLLTVVAPDWNGFEATLRRYERIPGAPWVSVGAPIDVVLGHAGLGWGRGLHGDGAPPGRSGPMKREGDGRSPAGAFSLGTAYGYGVRSSSKIEEATASHRCVDDPRSIHYNRIVSEDAVVVDWESAERMRRKDSLYEIALVVDHNTLDTQAGAGSCIFLHVWAGPSVPVRGCTAMSKTNLETLLAWLESDKAVLVALPQKTYEALRARWKLP